MDNPITNWDSIKELASVWVFLIDQIWTGGFHKPGRSLKNAPLCTQTHMWSCVFTWLVQKQRQLGSVNIVKPKRSTNSNLTIWFFQLVEHQQFDRLHQRVSSNCRPCLMMLLHPQKAPGYILQGTNALIICIQQIKKNRCTINSEIRLSSKPMNEISEQLWSFLFLRVLVWRSKHTIWDNIYLHFGLPLSTVHGLSQS